MLGNLSCITLYTDLATSIPEWQPQIGRNSAKNSGDKRATETNVCWQIKKVNSLRVQEKNGNSYKICEKCEHQGIQLFSLLHQEVRIVEARIVTYPTHCITKEM